MQTKIKIDLQKVLYEKSEIILELGCGRSKTSSRIGIDRIDLPSVDIVADLEHGLTFLPDNSVDSIYVSHLLEHIDNLDLLLRELHRVCKPNGKIVVRVPHFSNPHYYSDPTHRRFFGLYSFEYFAREQTHFKRKIHGFYSNFYFITKELELVFYSPWLLRKIPRKIGQFVFNLGAWWQEFYEENMCYLLPCSEIYIVLQPDKSNDPFDA